MVLLYYIYIKWSLAIKSNRNFETATYYKSIISTLNKCQLILYIYITRIYFKFCLQQSDIVYKLSNVKEGMAL